MTLAEQIQHLYKQANDADPDEARTVFASLRRELSAGHVRAAEPDASTATGWRVNTWVKEGILVGFRCGAITTFPSANNNSPYLDKDTLPLRHLSTDSKVRLVPGGSSIRDGAFLGSGVICMPPMYINIGAYVGDGSLIDSHALVGSCAQVGQRVHVSAAAQIGGVLEPMQANPTIIEDNCFIGARSEVVEGVIVGEGSVLSMGVFVGKSTKIINRSTGEVLYGKIPPYSVVVPGSMPSKNSPDGPALYCVVIIKQVDEKTRSKTSINDLLRE